MTLKERITAFVELGDFLQQFSTEKACQTNHKLNADFYQDFNRLRTEVSEKNPWFTLRHVQASIQGICRFLEKEKIEQWLSNYSVSDKNTGIRVAVVMAGNIPMVGFHDLLCVVLAGHSFIGKLSSKDNQLLDFVAKLLTALHPDFKEVIQFQQERLNGSATFDAIIATGSNNSARYFESYFKNYPNIIRKNRNAVAILTGHESDDELRALGKDVFLYFGLGCRNVSKIYIPKSYPPQKLLDNWEMYSDIVNHSKYANNYDYQRSILLLNQTQHFDNGFVLLQENEQIASPIGVVYYEYYSEIKQLKKQIQSHADWIQCVVSSGFEGAIPFGCAQNPELCDYADGIDTMLFLTQLKNQ